MKPPSYFNGTILLTAITLGVVMIALSGDAGIWLIYTLLTLIGGVLLWSIITQLRNAVSKPAHRLYAKDFSLKFLATLMGFLLVLGTGLYVYIFMTFAGQSTADNPVEFSNTEYLLRSLICSLDLFMLDVDNGLLDRLDGHGTLKAWLSVQAVLSFACTAAMIVGLVYARLHAYLRLHWRTKISNDKNHLYLFFGDNTPSDLLAADIIKNDPKAVCIIIDKANVSDDERDEVNLILNIIAHKHGVFKSAERIGAHVAIAGESLDDIDDAISSSPGFDAFGYLGIPKIRSFIEHLAKTTAPELHIFFMDNDEEFNIRNIITLSKDTTITKVANEGKIKHRIYCHARYNGPNSVIQDVALHKKLNIRIVDSSHIAVEILKLNSEFHPVNVAAFSKEVPATVNGPLTALIIGFGEVGRDAFRFLYEFGAFVSTEAPDYRAPFHCKIVDKNLNSISGTFKAAMPGIFRCHNNISFHATDYNSEDFYSDVFTSGFAAKVNYIVISIGNNDEAFALATRLFNHIRRWREDMSRVRILVRCTDDNKVETALKTADHYNYGYGKGLENQKIIHVFGQPSHTYTYSLMVNDRFIEEGKIFHEQYRRLAKDGDTWEMRHDKATQTSTPQIDTLRKLRRQESQDRANALHAATKIHILNKAFGENYDWELFYVRYFNGDGSANTFGSMSKITYPGLTDHENEIIRRLAMTEHLRWNAAHELMGYTFNATGNSCDERTRRHNCLCPWSRLDTQSRAASGNGWTADYKKFDHLVVDTTLALHLNKIK